MSDYNPYDSYEPNEPNEPMPTVPYGYVKKPLAPARPLTRAETQRPTQEAGSRDAPHFSGEEWETPAGADRTYARRTWDEEEFAANDPSAAPAGRSAREGYATETPASFEHAQRSENKYTRLTWDEASYDAPLSQAANVAEPTTDIDSPSHAGSARRSRTSAARDRAPSLAFQDEVFQADVDDTPMRSGAMAKTSPLMDRPEMSKLNPYARPAADTPDGVSDLSARFAPPLKFELPKATQEEPAESYQSPSRMEPNVYQTRSAAPAAGREPLTDPLLRANAYRVEAERGASGEERRSRRGGKRWIIVLLVLAVLAGAAYLERDWLLAQLKPLLGEQAIESVNQAINAGQTKTVGYDAAPALPVSDQANRGINAVAGGIGLESYAVTGRNVLERLQTGEGIYDYYLFAAGDGKLLGYYEGLGENDVMVCPGDVIYVAEPPYLIDAKGLPLIDVTRYSRAAGADAVLGPIINGWSIISNAAGTSYNYVNANGDLLSTLWFAKAYPFTANSTVAYVDTGNVADLEERYALYELNIAGDMKLWKHAADMNEVLGCACGVACLNDGRLILLDGKQTVLYTADEVAAYVDCGAIVARDPQTGKYGLFVNGEQQYDFAYDSIAPVAEDIRWAQSQNGLYSQFVVTGMAYPLPLSHYFALKKGDEQEMVALSTSSVYPLLLNDLK